MDFPPQYTGTDRATAAWASALTEWLLTKVPLAAPPPVPTDFAMPAVQITTASNITLTADQTNALYVVQDTAAISFTLPQMSPGEWVQVYNDSGSTNPITVKDYNGNTITTVAVGTGSKRITPDITGAYTDL